MATYLTVRSDDRYSRSTEAEPLAAFLRAQPGLRQSGSNVFGASEGSPWIDVVLAACDKNGNYRVDDETAGVVNIVELICSDHEDPQWYESLGTRIAEFLGWELFDHDDRRLWPVTTTAAS